MDWSDKATQQEELMRDVALRLVANTSATIPATGACHWCDSLLPAGLRFCDVDCRDGWEREQAARRRNGR